MPPMRSGHPSRAALSPLLFLPGLLFGGISRLRSALYARGWLRQQRLDAPVISIGNLTLGGTGKTPLVIHTAQLLLRMGAHPALLSRGYGRGSPETSHVLPPGNEVPSPARNLGDEPALIRRKVPEIWLGISADRHEVGLRILGRRPEAVFILDDGFQHRRLKRDLDILVIDAMQPLARNRLIPFGSLREPLSGMGRADLVIVNGGSGLCGADDLEAVIRRRNSSAPILQCAQRLSGFAPFERWNSGEALPAPAGFRTAYLVAAIGNPLRFARDVESLGIRVVGSSFFRDHHRISPRQWDECMRKAAAAGAEATVTTEKDAIKIRFGLDAPLSVALQSLELPEAEKYQQALAGVLQERR